ncbi:MAG: hypothetical protein K2G37_01595 [Clostridia bacterium]|nr:hypothetical protein [Clostridia bacterium]MDE7328507.1 hypothetical protein [Clostridia bacterium]
MKISLNGQWSLKKVDGEAVYIANVPGDVFSDLQANNVIPNPLIGLNEEPVQWVGRTDWEYSRTFQVEKKTLEYQYVELNCLMLDTLADVYINGKLIASVKNINRHYAWNIKDLLNEGENSIKIVFRSPLSYIADKHKTHPLPNSTLGEAGSCHIRKSPYHFGWDWGPHLLTCGISKDCFIHCYDICKITRLDIKQTHSSDCVNIDLKTHLSNHADDLSVLYTLSFDGQEICSADGERATLKVENPNLWWCNNMGRQPLYGLDVKVFKGDKIIAQKSQRIGLRAITLDKELDDIGRNFCFYINGKKLFARGANWIPADSFINNVSDEKLYDLLYKAKACNMNMIRVWGGGYYESDRFYDICDELGLLVWQDFNFACSPYPFDDKEFLDEVLAEVEDNVLRLKNHACLCLWAGNNEIESMSMAWLNRKKVIRDCGEFFYKILPAHLAPLDENTPYWACTPSSGEYMKNINSCNKGDTHLWHVWHGLRKLEYYKGMPTRFCSEFGIESLPSLNAIQEFCDGHEYSSVSCDLAKAHQKCIGGNGKIKYYTLSKFWTPKRFEDTVYLSQLTQALCIKNATEGWRINPRCHGALYWQYNDCWGVNSWSGMDYYGNMKALQYCARRFNQNTLLALQRQRSAMNILLVNDCDAQLKLKIEYGVSTYDGEEIAKLVDSVEIEENKVARVAKLDLKSILKKRKEKTCYVYALAYDTDGNIICQETLPLTNENKATLPKTKLSYDISLTNDTVKLTIKSTDYARFVEIRLKGHSTMLSDNYFDMLPSQEKNIFFDLPKGETLQSIKEKISVRSLCDVEKKHSAIKDKLIKAAIFWNPINLANYIARTFDK